MGRPAIALEEDCCAAWDALQARGGPQTLAETLRWRDVADLFPNRKRIEAARREGHLPGDQLSGSGGAWRSSRSNFVQWLGVMRERRRRLDTPAATSAAREGRMAYAAH